MSRVLVCDDEPHIVRALKVVLREAGFEAVTAETGEEALDRAAVRPPDAAILDLVLPDIDGIEVCRRLREWTEMPILVLSAVGDEEEKVRALEAGADDYVVKPFGPRELVARLQAALRRASGGPSDPVLRADGLELDVAAHTVRLEGDEVRAVRERQGDQRGARGAVAGGGGEPELVRRGAVDEDACGAGGGRGPQDAEEAVSGGPELLAFPRPGDERQWDGGRGRGADPGDGVLVRGEWRAAGRNACEALQGHVAVVQGVVYK